MTKDHRVTELVLSFNKKDWPQGFFCIKCLQWRMGLECLELHGLINEKIYWYYREIILLHYRLCKKIPLSNGEHRFVQEIKGMTRLDYTTLVEFEPGKIGLLIPKVRPKANG